MRTKLLSGVILIVLSFPAFAQKVSIIKSCSTILPAFEGYPGSKTNVTIYQTKKFLFARALQTDDIYSRSSQLSADIIKDTIRAEIFTKSESIEDLNPAEIFIHRALTIVEQPKFKGILSAGFNIKKIRSATIYTTGRGASKIPAIIEAKDKNGQLLGSFLLSTFVTPCK